MKDLFRLTFDVFSEFEYANFHRDFMRNAPFWLLRSGALLHGKVTECAGFPELYSYLQDASPLVWKNPELYPHLFRILHTGDDPEIDVRALGAHLGLREVTADSFTHRYFRLRTPTPRTLTIIDDELRVVEHTILSAEPDSPVVYLPAPHLFDDVVTGAATYVGSPLPISTLEVSGIIRDALNILCQYDVALHRGFAEAIGTVAITGEWNLGSRSSYSTGSLYTGGIFASVCAESPIPLVESFIHEYYHQRIWQWWFIEIPKDLPERDVVMTSPVSKQQRPVQVMMHALMIYGSLADYYRWASEMFADDSGWCGARAHALHRGWEQLLAALREVLTGRAESLRFVDTVAECTRA